MMAARILAIALASLLCFVSAAAEVTCDRIVAIGDLHGGYEDFIAMLQQTGLIGEELLWRGGTGCLVQEGDLVDRGDRSREILDFLMELKPQAPERIFVLLGNHEFMNITGDLRYVSPEEFAAFAGDETAAERTAGFEAFLASEAAMDLDRQPALELFDKNYPRGWFAKRRAFAPDGRYGEWLLEQPTIVEIDGTIFVHGGLAPVDAYMGIDRINEAVRQEVLDQHQLRGRLESAGWIDPLMSLNDAMLAVDKRYSAERQAPEELRADPEVLQQAERYLALARGFGMRPDGPLWHRSYADGDETVFEKQLGTSLAALGAERIVVAHTNTADGLIQSRFGDRVFNINTGAGPAYEGSISALVIGWTGKIRAVYPGSEELLAEASPSDRQIEEFLLHGEVIESEEIGVGISRPKKLLLQMRGETMKAAFKTIDMELTGKLQIKGKPARPGFTDRAIYERAAYLLDRFLGMNMIPVAVMRTIGKEEGAVVHWVSGAVSEMERREQKLEPPDPAALARQRELMLVFDVLIENEDRNLGNILITPDDWQLHLIDHSRSFRLDKVIPKRWAEAPVKLTRPFYDRLQAMDQESMYELLDGVLSKSRIRALISRRNKMVEKIENDREAYGEDSVFWDEVSLSGASD